jgi:hypothetical protein
MWKNKVVRLYQPGRERESASRTAAPPEHRSEGSQLFPSSRVRENIFINAHEINVHTAIFCFLLGGSGGAHTPLSYINVQKFSCCD